MPVLSPAYLGSLQKVILINDANTPIGSYLLESITQNQTNTLNSKPMIQGALGVRIMDVGEIFWQTQIESTAIITEPSNLFLDIFSLIIDRWDNMRLANTGAIPTLPLLEEATINISKEGVKCSVKLLGDKSYFNVEFGGVPDDLIARVVKWYDCSLLITGINAEFPDLGSLAIPIESANINLQPTINKRFFIGTSQAPFFSVESYKISGSITVVATAADIALVDLIEKQPSGQLVLTGPGGMSLNIGGKILTIGLRSMQSQVQAAVRAGDVNKITFNFTSYTL